LYGYDTNAVRFKEKAMEEEESRRQQVKAAWKKYQHLWTRVEVPAKRVLLKEGMISRKAYVIQRGCLRVWFNHNGREISFQFFFEGEVVLSVESFRKHIPSPFNIETVEPSVLFWIGREDLDGVLKEDVFLNNYLMDWAVERQAAFIRHFFSFLKDTPRQRYENLLQERPQIIQRVPLQYIASYLGITPVSLSRIRNKG
jgi:CRP-like cAMP-binding protein